MSQSTGNRAPLALVSGVTATAIVIADMVGIGVFTSLGFQVGDITSGFALLLLWIVGGAVALCGALCYAELATMLPRSSGEYNFLRRIYHPAFGFVAGWLSATVGFAAPIALAAMAFGVYFKAIAPNAPPLLLGLGLTWVLALVHLCGVQVAGAFHNAWTIFKLAPIATYIAGEVQNPARNLPRALLVGTAVVIVLYVALNAVMLATTPLSELAGQLDVAMVAGRHIFGPLGARFVGGLISLGLVSSISAMMWIGPRVTMTMGEDMPALRLFARKSKAGVPAIAIAFQLLIANLLLLTQSFEKVLDFTSFSLTFCSFFTVLGVIKMRITHPELVRPYRAWGYPVTPLAFLSLTLFMMYYLVVNRPLQSLGGLGLMAAGLVIYYASNLFSNVPPSNSYKTIPRKADALDRV